jgi:hypothetical protein
MNVLRTMLICLSMCALASCSASQYTTATPGVPEAPQSTPPTAVITPPPQVVLRDLHASTPCLHLQHRNPVVDVVEIKGGLRGGVYTPTHYEWVVYHSGAWEVVDSAGQRLSAVPGQPLGCPPTAGTLPPQHPERP